MRGERGALTKRSSRIDILMMALLGFVIGAAYFDGYVPGRNDQADRDTVCTDLMKKIVNAWDKADQDAWAKAKERDAQ